MSGLRVDRDESPEGDGAESPRPAPGRLYALLPLLFVLAFVGVLALVRVGVGSPGDRGATPQEEEASDAVVSSGDEAEQALISAWER